MSSQGRLSDGDDEDPGSTSNNQNFRFSMTGGDRTNVTLGNATVEAEENAVLESLRVDLTEEYQNPVPPNRSAASNEPPRYPAYTGGRQGPSDGLVRRQPSTSMQTQDISANLGQHGFDFGYQDPFPPRIPNPQGQNPSQCPNPCPAMPQPQTQDHIPPGTIRGPPGPFHQLPNVGPMPSPSHQNPIPWNATRPPRGGGFLNRGSSRLARRGNSSAGAPTSQSNFVPRPQPGQPTGSRQTFSNPPRSAGGPRSSLAPLDTQNLGKRKLRESSGGSTPSGSDVRRGNGGRSVRPRHDEPKNAEEGGDEEETAPYPMANLRLGSIIYRDGFRYLMQADGTFRNIPAPVPAASPAPDQNPPLSPPPGHVRRQSAHNGGDTYNIENHVIIHRSQYVRSQHDPPVEENEEFMPPGDHAPFRGFASYDQRPSYGTANQGPLPSYGHESNPQTPYNGPGYGDQNYYYNLGLRGPGPGRVRGHGPVSSSNPYGSPHAPSPANYSNVPPHGCVPNLQPPATAPYSYRTPNTQGQHHPPPPPPPPPQTPINPSNVRKPSQRVLAKAAKKARGRNIRRANVQLSTGNGKSHLVVAPPGFPSVPPRGETSHDILLDTARNRPDDFMRLYPNDVYDYYGWIVARGLGSSSNFYECFRKHHKYDKYVTDTTTPWRNSLGKKIASLGKNYFGPLPGWGYILQKEERLSDFVEADNWLENGKPKVRFGKKIIKEEDNVVETEIEEDPSDDGSKAPGDGEGSHGGGTPQPENNNNFEELDAEASTTQLDPNLDQEMLEYRMTPQY